MESTKVLIRLHPGYGLGDHCQMTAVLRHVAKNRPGWSIDFQGDAGKSDCMVGIVNQVFTHTDAPPEAFYDRAIDVDLYDTFCGWADRPNTRVSSCLHEKFGMGWERELARYQINVTASNKFKALAFLESLGCRTFPTQRSDTTHGVVCVQYQGDSAQERKNLSHAEAVSICRRVEELGRVPLLFDWRGESPICAEGGIKSVAHYPMHDEWGKSAQMNAAIISQCEAFVGIDSGPGKCASATNTPALIVWTKHHPALYHDPAPNTTHLVPADHERNLFLKGNRAAVDFFVKNYNVRTYDQDPVPEVRKWLSETLR